MLYILNQSRKTFVIAGVRLEPNETKEFDEGVYTFYGVTTALADGDLALVDKPAPAKRGRKK